MKEVFTKSLGVHSRLNLDDKWTNHVLAEIRDKSWRVLLKPVELDDQRFIAEVDGRFMCNFDFVHGELSWNHFNGDYLATIKHHLELLPRLIRDLSDSSQSLFPSTSHSKSWKESANQAINILEGLSLPELTLEIRNLLMNCLSQVITKETPCEIVVHGDFHPGNVMISGAKSNFSATVIDLENITFGSIFVDFLYCSTWGRLANEPLRYWDLMSYLELKYERKINEIDVGLAASLMLNQAQNNTRMTSQRIVLGLFWMVSELMTKNRISN